MAGREIRLSGPIRPRSRTVDVTFEFSHHSMRCSSTSDLGLTRPAVGSFVVGTTGMDTLTTRSARPSAARARRRIGARADRGARPSAWERSSSAMLAEYAARLFGTLRRLRPLSSTNSTARPKADRPSGTALAVANRLVPHLEGEALGAPGHGSPDAPDPDGAGDRGPASRQPSPGMHTVGFDGPGESLRDAGSTARDRSAYVSRGPALSADTPCFKQPERTGTTAFTDPGPRTDRLNDTNHGHERTEGTAT